MGIQVEFNPDLALREFGSVGRLEDECLPENLEIGRDYNFLKKGQRNYWLHGQVPLLRTQGEEKLSRPLASISILEATHFLRDGEVYTKGIYRMLEVFDENDDEIKFESYARVNKK